MPALHWRALICCRSRSQTEGIAAIELEVVGTRPGKPRVHCRCHDWQRGAAFSKLDWTNLGVADGLPRPRAQQLGVPREGPPLIGEFIAFGRGTFSIPRAATWVAGMDASRCRQRPESAIKKCTATREHGWTALRLHWHEAQPVRQTGGRVVQSRFRGKRMRFLVDDVADRRNVRPGDLRIMLLARSRRRHSG